MLNASTEHAFIQGQIVYYSIILSMMMMLVILCSQTTTSVVKSNGGSEATHHQCLITAALEVAIVPISAWCMMLQHIYLLSSQLLMALLQMYHQTALLQLMIHHH